MHNEYVKNALALRGIRTIEDPQRNRVQLLDEVESGVVIFTAHGISDQARAKAEQKGLICVDASCPDVVRTQELVRERLNQGDEVFYIGKKRHPEAEAVCALSRACPSHHQRAGHPRVRRGRRDLRHQSDDHVRL